MTSPASSCRWVSVLELRQHFDHLDRADWQELLEGLARAGATRFGHHNLPAAHAIAADRGWLTRPTLALPPAADPPEPPGPPPPAAPGPGPAPGPAAIDTRQLAPPELTGPRIGPSAWAERLRRYCLPQSAIDSLTAHLSTAGAIDSLGCIHQATAEPLLLQARLHHPRSLDTLLEPHRAADEDLTEPEWAAVESHFRQERAIAYRNNLHTRI